MRNILVTGAAGFIGSHLCERFLLRGDHVIGLDNFDDYYPRVFKENNIAQLQKDNNFRLIRGDLRDKECLLSTMTKCQVDGVVHLAARAGVRPSIQNPALYSDVNVTGTTMLLEAMREVGVRKMLFASSSSVYGNRNTAPFSENEPVDSPISPYAATKRAGELLCYNYHHLHGFQISCLRFFTAYGPRQRPDMAIHRFVRKIYGREPIHMYGDGSTERDYTFIEDIINGIVLAYDKSLGFEIYNLGESQRTSLRRLISIIEKNLETKAVVESFPLQPGDVFLTCADITKAKTLLGYSPTTTIEEGMKIFCGWYKSNLSWLVDQA